MKEIIYDEIKDKLEYNPETGVITWKKSNHNIVGKEAGWFDKHTGYRRITINNETYGSHRIAYCLYHKSIPNDLVIDHINGDRNDNKINNLRAVDYSKNAFNRKKESRNIAFNKSRNVWVCYERQNGKQKHLKQFKNEEDAENFMKLYKENKR